MITIVSGFGRCGSSLVMQMLNAGGMKTVGHYPSFEDPIANVGGPLLGGSTEVAALIDGCAVKILDPHSGRLPPWEYRVIWCKRAHLQQAKSQVKMLNLMMGIPAGREQVRAFERSYRKDEPRAMDALRRAGAKAIHTAVFEDTLRSPLAAALELAAFCGLSHEVVPAMTACVRSREVGCAQGMDMELRLLSERMPPPDGRARTYR